MSGKQFVVVTLFAFVLLTVALVPLSSQPDGKYDPWADMNWDGKIDVYDLSYLGTKYGTEGSPERIITTDMIADGAVTTIKLADGNVTSIKIMDGEVTALDLADGSVITMKIANGAVTSEKIADLTITGKDLADLSIASAKIADGAVENAKLADGAVTTFKLADGSVTTVKILDGTITGVDLADLSIVTAKIANGAITTDKIANNAVTNDKLASSAIPFASTSETSLEETIESSYVDIPGMSVSISLSRQSHLLITFSGAAYISPTGLFLFVRALIDSTVASPSYTAFTSATGYSSHSFTFYMPNVALGVKTVKMQWMVFMGFTGYMSVRSLNVIALPA